MEQELPELSEREREALHELTLGIEHVHRAYGHLLAFHHEVGRGMDEFDDARERLRAEGHDEFADRLRDEVLPAGVVGDRWSYEVVEAFERDLLDPACRVERAVRDALAGGLEHVSEREQRRRWRERARR